jgi:hypothetical protein
LRQDLAGLPLADTAEGWDNHLFRLGDALAVRLPRRALAANLGAVGQATIDAVLSGD